MPSLGDLAYWPDELPECFERAAQEFEKAL